MKQKLKELISKFDEVEKTQIEAVDRMRKAMEAAKKEGQQIRKEKG